LEFIGALSDSSVSKDDSHSNGGSQKISKLLREADQRVAGGLKENGTINDELVNKSQSSISQSDASESDKFLSSAQPSYKDMEYFPADSRSVLKAKRSLKERDFKLVTGASLLNSVQRASQNLCVNKLLPSQDLSDHELLQHPNKLIKSSKDLLMNESRQLLLGMPLE